MATRKPTRKSSAIEPAAPRPIDLDALRERLTAAIPQPRCELDHKDAWTLLIATILSAQSTDRTVNTVTPVLFAKWPTPLALATAPREEVEQVVHRTGFFRNKTKAIQGASRVVHDQFGGEVPRDLDELIKLPGVARKTANVVLGVAYGIPAGIVVDTHVMRVSRRLGLTQHQDADKVEQDLCHRFDRDDWIAMGHRILLHGRYVCLAKSPDCQNCPLAEICPSRDDLSADEPVGSWQDRSLHERVRVGSGAQ